ncbi:CheR family methyltransferase [Thioalkalivibrio sp.]|uniref:CheR family methyltransferase n=1 Tax=Thioalkalivibrio sp. TaxID=2093813 RepID=UPI00397590B7
MEREPSVQARDREFVFTDGDFDRIRGLIHAHAGIALNPGKRDMVYSRLARRLRALGIGAFGAYLEQLQPESEEWQHFVNALTTNLTSFFREAHHFPVLAERVTAARRRGPVSLWSSACSSGEEAYSMAMTAIDALGSFAPPVRILATDLDTQVLERAARGVYPLERVAALPEVDVRRFFQRGKGAQAGFVRVRPEVRDLVTFRPLNLLGPRWPIRGPFDAIFCRNVLIYFDKPTQYRLLSRFHPLLHPEGLLFLGHSENVAHAADLFRLRGKTVCAPVARERAA